MIMRSFLFFLVTLAAVTCEPGELALPPWQARYSSGHLPPSAVRNGIRINSEYEGDNIDFIPKIYPPQFNRRDIDATIRADMMLDALIGNITTADFDRVVTVTWNSTRDSYNYPEYNDINVLKAISILFETSGNITRMGYATAAEVQGNSNEIILTGSVRLPIPRITINVRTWNKVGMETIMDAIAVSARDVVMNVQLIVNRQWKQIFVTNVTPKENVVFRANFKCDGEKSFDFCKQVQEILSREVLGRIDNSMRDAIKFRLEELELDM